MIVEMKVPSPGESISEVEIAAWLVAEGEYVDKDQEICEIDSDKATLTLAAEHSGAISIKVSEGDTVAVGDIVCTIDTSVKGSTSKTSKKEASVVVETPSMPAVSTTYASGSPSPAARKMISELDIDVKQGTGKGGRITKDDVVKADSQSQLST